MQLAATPHRAAAQALFSQVLNLLHDHPDQRGRIHNAIQQWYTLCLAATGVNAFDYNTSPDIDLPTGLALGASAAAFCLLEAQRTAVFLRGIEHAIRDLQRRFPGKRTLILYAGCGPYASLLTPLTARFAPHQVGFHLVDINPASLESVRRLYHSLALSPWLLDTQLADAATLTLPPGTPFHLIISETMQRTLQNESQLAIMRNLIPQLQPGALFLPERISIAAELLRETRCPQGLPQPHFQPLQTIYTVGSGHTALPKPLNLTIPPLDSPASLALTTTVQVYGHERLAFNDASITLPKRTHLHLTGGERVHIGFHSHPRPGFAANLA